MRIPNQILKKTDSQKHDSESDLIPPDQRISDSKIKNDFKADTFPTVDAKISDIMPICPSTGNTLNVPSPQFSNIPSAIAASKPGDTIKVAPGNYSFLNEKLKHCTKLIGSGKNQTIIEYKVVAPNYPQGYILAAADQSTISDLSINVQGPGSYSWCYITPPSDFVNLILEDGEANIKTVITDCIHVSKNAGPLIDSNNILIMYITDQAKPII